MRIKNDTIIKWSNLAATMYLSNEEFGALIRNVMIEDDKDNLHHQYVPEVALKFLKGKEDDWRKDFEELCNKNPQLIQAFITVHGQAAHSHRAFDKLQEKYDTEDLEDDKEVKKEKFEKLTYKTSYGTFKTKVFKDNIRNALPRKKEDIDAFIDELEYEVGNDNVKETLQKIFEEAEKDFYKLQFYEYVNKELKGE